MDISPYLSRAALVEDGRLAQLLVDSQEQSSLVGNIYAAQVKDLSSTGFAFLNIGTAKNGLLQLDDYRQKGLGKISSGTRLIVQVLREGIGEKGPMLSATLSFGGRLIVLIKNQNEESFVRLSSKITDEVLRERLKKQLFELCPAGYGIIVRSAAVLASDEELSLEINTLHESAEKILESGKHIKPPALLYGDERLYSRSLKELLDQKPECIIINAQSELEQIKALCGEYPGNIDVTLHKGQLGLFDTYSINAQAERALHHKIWLDCGGYLLIEEAAAATYIDVNSGKISGKKNFETAAAKVNAEAAAEIACQIRLKNLSGLIIVDFINSRLQERQDELKAVFTDILKKDPSPAIIIDWSQLNIVQLTRKKRRPTLKETLTEACNCCKGTGVRLKPNFFADKIYKEIIKIYSEGFYDKIEVKTHKDIAVVLKKADIAAKITVIHDKPPGYYEIVKAKS